MIRMAEHWQDLQDAQLQFQMECEHQAYEEWAALLAADPAYPLWLESINTRKEDEIRS